MKEFFSNAFSGIALNDIIDILIVAFVIYKLLGLIKQTRAEQLLKGVVVLVVATFVTDLLAERYSGTGCGGHPHSVPAGTSPGT